MGTHLILLREGLPMNTNRVKIIVKYFSNEDKKVDSESQGLKRLKNP